MNLRLLFPKDSFSSDILCCTKPAAMLPNFPNHNSRNYLADGFHACPRSQHGRWRAIKRIQYAFLSRSTTHSGQRLTQVGPTQNRSTTHTHRSTTRPRSTSHRSTTHRSTIKPTDYTRVDHKTGRPHIGRPYTNWSTADTGRPYTN